MTLRLLAFFVLAAPLAVAAQTPFTGNPIALPGTLEAENFDLGGEGVAYHDNVAGNAGLQYRTSEDVDIVVTRDTSGGFSVNNFETGEWMAYTVDIAQAGQYEIAVRTASGTTGGAFRIEIDGHNVTGSVTVPPTGNFGTYQWIAKTGVSLPAGRHVLKLVSEQQYFDVNQIRVTATPTTPFAGVIPLPGTFEAENFDTGGEGLAYHDNAAGNAGGAYRTTEDVDIKGTTDYVVTNFETGEWLVYTVNVPSSGLYDIEVRASNGLATDGALRIEVDGANVTGTVAVPETGSFDAFEWFGKKGVALAAGQHVLKLFSEAQYFDVTQIRVTQVLHSPFSGTPIALPGTFEAEDFDRGGEGNAYHDNVAGNAGGQYRTDESVDIKGATDFVVTNFETGEWLVYTVNVAQAGNYDIEVSASNGLTATSAFHVEIDGANVTQSVAVAPTGSFDTFAWFGKKGVPLTAGQHVLKLFSEAQYFDVNQIRVVASTAAPGANPPSLLFRSGYEAGTRLAPPQSCTVNICRQPIEGADSSTGFAWPPAFVGGNKRFEMRPGGESTNPTPSTIGQYMHNELRTVTGPRNTTTTAMYSEISKTASSGTARQGGGVAQMPYMILPESDVPELYISQWVKFQPDLLARMERSGDWRVLFEWKTADNNRRLKLEAIHSSFPQRLFWRVRLDDLDTALNKWIPIWTEPPAEPSSSTSPVFDVPVPVGEWFKLEVYWRRAGSELRAWMAVNGKKIVDKTGPHMGSANQINRIFVNQLYTSTTYPVFQWVDDVQIWSTFPTANPGDPWYDPPYAPH